MQSSLSSNLNVILPYIAGSSLLINDAVGHKKFKQQTKTRETFYAEYVIPYCFIIYNEKYICSNNLIFFLKTVLIY